MIQRAGLPRSELRTRAFTVDEVGRMLAAGVLSEDDPVELIEGELIVVSPQGPEHAGSVGELALLLRATYGEGFHVREEKPLACGPTSLPEPDLVVAPGRPRDFARRHPSGTDAVLVIEVASTSQTLDRLKADVYARAGVPEYWLLDLDKRTLEVFATPTPDGYRSVTRLLADERVAFPSTSASTTLHVLLR